VTNGSDARNNWITHSDRAGVFIDGNNNDVQRNRINEAAYGVLKATGFSGNIIANNDFFNAAVPVQDPTGRRNKASPYR